MTDKTEDVDTHFMKAWPIVDMMDFESVVISATRWDSGEYTAVFNFYHTTGEDGEANTGMSLATHIGGLTLRELYLKVEAMFQLGLFDGTEIEEHGQLFDERGEELAAICWHQFSDEEWDPETDDDMSALVIEVTSDFPPPTMIQ